jgi:ion channel POLLUX/CASTOR
MGVEYSGGSLLMKKCAFLDWLRYKFDTTLSTGPFALVWWLGLVSLLLIIATSLVVLAVTGHEMGVFKIAWSILFQALTPNPVDVGAGPWPFLLAMLFITLCSLFMFSILIGVLAASIEDRMQSLRKGRSQVQESDHYIILGWDEHIYTIISELVTCNAHRARSCIVILGNKDKLEMEEKIREKVGSTGRTRVVCRSGDPINQADLVIVSLNTARSIIILPPDDEDPDSSVIKTLLAITNTPTRRPEPYHIVTEIRSPANIEAARLVGGREAEILQISHLTSLIIAQTCRRSGLSTVYQELMDFAGDEIYFQEEPALVGRTFGHALFAYEDSSVIGIQARDGQPTLNPPMDMIIREGDRIIAISENDETIKLSSLERREIDRQAILHDIRARVSPEHTLIMGWNWRAPTVIRELDNYVSPGSSTTVVVEDPALEAQVAEIGADLKNQALQCVVGSTTERRSIDRLGVESYERAIVLAYSDSLSVQKADARTLITLLHLRDIAKRTGRPCSIVSELLDDRNRSLAEVTEADDFIVSGKVSSLLMAQISENKQLHAVFQDLFDAEGSEIYLKPASDYLKLGVPINFYTVVEAMRQHGDVAIGYRIRALARDPAQGFGVVVNPDKSKPVTFCESDRIIVLAENE